MTTTTSNYRLHVEFTDGRQYTEPLEPGYGNKEDKIVATILWQYLEGNYSCDCNRLLFYCRYNNLDEPFDPPCGETMQLKSLTLIRPDGSNRKLRID